MKLRTAQKGPNAGNDFWGCSKFPQCREVVNIESDDDDMATAGTDASRHMTTRSQPVRWVDGTLFESGWDIRYVRAGASLRSATSPTGGGLCWIAREKRLGFHRADSSVVRAVAVLCKIIRRGYSPPIHPESEHLLMESQGLNSHGESPLPGDISPVAVGEVSISDQLSFPGSLEGLDLRNITESNEETLFLNWLEENLLEVIPFVVPQASFDLLLDAANEDVVACRRCDFLIALPDRAAFVVEIDGSQHQGQRLTDDDRDRVLEGAGIATLRISTGEVRNGSGAALSELRRRCEGYSSDETLDPLVWAPLQLHRLVTALSEAVLDGFLSGERWVVKVADPTELAVQIVGPYLQLFAAILKLWNLTESVPAEVIFVGNSPPLRYRHQEDGSYISELTDETEADVEIRLECDKSPLVKLPSRTEAPLIVVRSAFLPVRVSDPPASGTDRQNLVETDETKGALQEILHAVFAKEDLRSKQYEAIVQMLSGNDATVLLPTGAGKSLIYQIAGLCQPGCTIVVDPLVALMEDQIEGLQRYGIERGIDISSRTTQLGLTKQRLALVAQGEPQFIFVSPERLQMQDFREALTSLSGFCSINLAVIDEAHCVSEWGHDFRTAYLSLGSVLRKWCATPQGTPPPLAALTGTASRAVLKDLIFQLEMGTSSPNSVIKPGSFDRSELSFSIVRTSPDAASASLSGQLLGLPNKFGANPATFFQPTGDLRTNSGLVFVPTVNGKPSIPKTRELCSEVTGAEFGVFSGKAPRGFNKIGWQSERRHYASEWKKNNLIALATTNAFGMGIDKPNVRWVIHYGIPSSMEAYYQEAGRAGRDGNDSQCVLILSQFDEANNRRLLATDLDLELVRESSRADWNARDDISTALFFHTSSFPGVDDEIVQLQETLQILSPSERPSQLQIPFASGTEEINQDQAHGNQARAIHRLVILGIINDYTKDYGGKSYTINLAGVTPERVSNALLDFVNRNQPQQFEAVSEEIRGNHRSIAEAIDVCGRALIRFVYETIERSRRRSLREMWLAAVECRSGDELRARILNYLNEGDSSPALTGLVEGQATLREWSSVWRTLTPQDADDWRGSSGQLLVSYPDNPGLLITRGLVEALDPSGSLDEFDLNVIDGIEKAFASNEPDKDINLAIGVLLELVHVRHRSVAARVLALLHERNIEIESATRYLNDNWKTDQDLMVLYLANALDNAIPLAQEAVLTTINLGVEND